MSATIQDESMVHSTQSNEEKWTDEVNTKLLTHQYRDVENGNVKYSKAEEGH